MDDGGSKSALQHFVFGLTAVTVIVISVLIANHAPKVSDALLAMGISVGSVTLITAVWSVQGGSPMDRKFGALTSDVAVLHRDVSALHNDNALARSVAQTGLKAFHADRQEEIDARNEQIRVRGRTADSIDLLGFTLYNNWFSYAMLQDVLHDVIQRDGRVRLAVLDTHGPAYEWRHQQPGERDDPARLPSLINLTCTEIRKLWKRAKPDERDRLIIRHPTVQIYQTIIRIGDYMFVAPYLGTKEGDEGYGFEIVGVGTSMYQLMKAEFDAVFDSSLPTNWTFE